jgi:MFS family permease
MMRPTELYRTTPPPRTKGEVRAGVRYVRSMPHLWISFAMLGAIGTVSYNFNVTLPLFVTDALHGSEGAFTILYSVFSLGAVASALVVAQRRLVGIRHIVLGAVALGLTMLLLAVVPGVAAAAPAVFLVGMASILYMTATTAILQVEARHDMHGRVLALQSVVLIGTAPVGGPALGWLADAAGARAPMVVGGVVALLAAAFGWWATRRHPAGSEPGQPDEPGGQPDDADRPGDRPADRPGGADEPGLAGDPADQAGTLRV